MELADTWDLKSHIRKGCTGSNPVTGTSVGAKSAQLRFRHKPKAFAENCVRSLAPPLKSEAHWLRIWFFFCAQSPLGFVSGNSLRLLPKTALTTLRLLSNPKPAGFGFVFSFAAAYMGMDAQHAEAAKYCLRVLHFGELSVYILLISCKLRASEYGSRIQMPF